MAVLQSELYDDIEIRVRADSRPWRPVPDLPSASPYWVDSSHEDAAIFSAVALGDEDRLAGEALLWDIDLHNRGAHIGVSILPEFRGRGFGTDVTNLLCYYGFSIRGFHRLQVDTLATNEAMIRAARRLGFTQEGLRRDSAWVDGSYVDEVIMGLMSHEWQDRSQKDDLGATKRTDRIITLGAPEWADDGLDAFAPEAPGVDEHPRDIDCPPSNEGLPVTQQPSFVAANVLP